MKLILKIFFFSITISASLLFAQGKSFSHKLDITLFQTDFGYEVQSINLKNLPLCGKYFHYKIFNHKGLKWEKMSIESRPDSHYLIETNMSRFHIVFMNFDQKTSKIYFTIGKPPNYTHTGAVAVKTEIDPDFFEHFDISSAYTLSIRNDGFHSTDYMAVFFTFRIPNNHYLESNVLLLCETDDRKLTYSILPGKQISTSPHCFIDYNHDGWLDYVHFNPFVYPEPKVSFYTGNKTNFALDPEFYGSVKWDGEYTHKLDMSKSNFP